MNYHLKSKTPQGKYFKVIIVVVTLAILLVLGMFRGTVGTVLITAGKPIWFFRDGIVRGADTVGVFFTSKSALLSENDALSAQVESLKMKEVDYDILLKENQELKTILGRNSTDERIFARILSKPPQSPYDTLVVDAGSGDGVALGDKVYLAGNVIVGTVTNVTPYTSLVTLFSGSSQKTDAVLERTGTTYEISGSGATNLRVDVPKETDVLWGDVFVYPALTSGVIGSVYYIDTNSQSSFKTIYIRMPGNVFSAKWVFIEKNK